MEKVIEKSAIERLRAFFDGRWFPCVFAVIMFICGQLALDILGFFIPRMPAYIFFSHFSLYWLTSLF